MTRMICCLPVLLLLSSLAFPQQIWLPQTANLPSNVTVGSLSAANNQVCWVAGLVTPSNTTPYHGYSRTTDGGVTWMCDTIAGAEDGYLSQIEALDANTAYAAVYQWPASPTKPKGVFKTTDGGATWTKQNAFSSSQYGAGCTYFFDANNGVAIGDPNLETYTTTDGGLNWNLVGNLAASADEYTWAHGTSIAGAGNRVWFSSTKRIFRSTDRGHTWSASVPINAFVCIAFQDSNTGICTIYPNLYRKTTDGGVTWKPFSNPVIDNIYPSCIRHVPGTRSTYLVTGGQLGGKKGFACTHDAGGDWTLIDTSGMGIIAFSSDSIGWGSPDSPNSVYKYVGPRLITSVESEITPPASYLLAQNYPNPFNPSTTIKYELPKSTDVKLSVFDMLGREVSVLVNDRRNAGFHEVRFDGSGLSSGVYFYRLQAGTYVETRKLLLLR